MLLFGGCQQIDYAIPTSRGGALAGSVHGGKTPISGSSIQLYAAGATGDGSPAQPLLTKMVKTGSDGSFSISGDYTCPSADAEVYIVATGGVSFPGGSENPAISLMTVLGPCGQLTNSTNYEINEVTTIAATWGLRGYMSSLSVLGAPRRRRCFRGRCRQRTATRQRRYRNFPQAPRSPAGYAVQVSKLYALADIVAACVNSDGGVAGDGSVCGNFFASVQRSVTGQAPTDTISAAVAVAHFPTINVDQIFSLLPAAIPFSPTITSAPADWKLSLLQLPPPPAISPAAGTYAAGEQVALSTSTSGATIYYTVDGSQPTTSSLVYKTPFALTGSETVHAISVETGLVSAVASATYTVTTSHLVFATQPSNTLVSSAISPAPAIEVVDDLSGKIVTNTTSPVTISVSANPGHLSLTGSTTAVPMNGIVSFPNLSLAGAASGYTLTASSTGMPSINSNSFNITQGKLGLVVSNAAPTVGSNSTGTITLSAPAQSSVTVNLFSSGSSQVSVTPQSLTIPAGSASGAFTYTANATGTATLSATATNYSAGSMQITVAPDPIISLSLSNTALTVGGSLTGSINLSTPPASPVTIAVRSSAPATISTSPAQVTIAAGASSGNFTYTAGGAGSATLTASATNYTAGFAQITALPDPVLSISLPNTTPTVGSSFQGMVKLSAPAVSAVTLSLISGFPNLVSVSPASLTIPAGATSGNFTYTAGGVGSTTLTASVTNYTAGLAQITVLPDPVLSISLPNMAPTVGSSFQGTVKLSAPAVSAVTLSLTSGFPNLVSVSPASLTIPAGATSGNFTYTAGGAGSATLTASATNYTAGFAQITALPDPVLSISLPNTTPTVGSSFQGMVKLSAPAVSAVTLSLISGFPNLVSVSPASLTIPAGATSGNFTYTAGGVGSTTLTASVTNYTAGLAQITVLPDPVLSISLPNMAPTVGSSFQGTVKLSAPAVSAVTLSLISGFPNLVSVSPASLTIPAGATSGNFTYTAGGVGSTTLTASVTNYTAGLAQITVLPDPVLSISLPNMAPTVGSSFQGTVKLSAPAVSAVTLSLTSGFPNLVSVSPASLTIPAGATSDSFTYTTVAVGSSTLTATAPLYTAGSIAVSAVPAVPVIPSSLFGLTALNYYNLNPTLTYGTTRTWDSYPNLDWSDANPSPGVYEFEWLDHFIALNQARSTDIIYTLGRTPQWASSQPNTTGSYGPGQCAAPANMSDYDAYLTALVTHEKGNIKYYELWNEPQSVQMYCGTMQQMVTMAQHAAQIVKSIDPNAQIISPGVTGGPGPAWLSTFLAAGGSSYVDGIAFHGYWSASAEDLISLVNSYKTVMAANGVATKPMYDTESSWAGFGNLGTPSMTSQVSYVAKSYLLHWSAGISRFVWFAYDGGTTWGGMLTSTGAESAAATSYKQVYSWMVGAYLSTPCAQASNGIYTCGLTRPGGYSAQAVWIPNSTATYTVAAGFTQYQDLAGVVHPITGNTIPIQDQPILLETGNLQ